MSPHSRWLSLAVLAMASLIASGCNCGNARIVMSPDGGNPYDRNAPAHGFTGGATVSKSQNFKMVGEVNAPSGTSSKSQNFQLKGGVVEASQ